MAYKHPETSRIREIMAFFGCKDNPHGFATEVLKWERSDKWRNVFTEHTRITTEILVEITQKAVTDKGQRIDLNWVISGLGEMFLKEKPTPGTNSGESTVNLDKILVQLSGLLEANIVAQNTIANQQRLIDDILRGKVVKEGKQDTPLAEHSVTT